MPEYLAPGVYVEETDAGVTPIPGVTTSTTGVVGSAMIERIASAVRASAPEWTDANTSDPGITLLELLAFVADDLGQRAVTPQARNAAARAVAALTGVATPAPACPPVTRPRFFAGRLLTADDLAREQAYHRHQARRATMALHGSGIVAGLAVQVDGGGPGGGPGGAPRVAVAPGVAVAPDGALLTIGCAVRIAVMPAGDAVFVTLRYGERAAASVASGNPPVTETSEIEEIAVLALVAVPGAHDVPLARLVRTQGHWRVDPSFAAPRARPPV